MHRQATDTNLQAFHLFKLADGPGSHHGSHTRGQTAIWYHTDVLIPGLIGKIELLFNHRVVATQIDKMGARFDGQFGQGDIIIIGYGADRPIGFLEEGFQGDQIAGHAAGDLQAWIVKMGLDGLRGLRGLIHQVQGFQFRLIQEIVNESIGHATGP